MAAGPRPRTLEGACYSAGAFAGPLPMTPHAPPSTAMAPLPAWQRVAVVALPLLTMLLSLGSAPLFDVDEGAFSEATREMFERRDFLSTWLDGEPRFDKPILVYWLQALAVLALGLDEWAFRLPSALAACGWAWAVWAFARPRMGNDVAFGALLVTATALGPWAIGRAATADALLNLWLVLTLFDAWRHHETGARAPLLRAYVWIGLGVLTKGPVAIVVPAAVTLLYLGSRRDWRAWLRLVFDPVGWVILLALTVPWYAAVLAVHGQAFIDGFIMKHNVKRFTGTLEGHAGSIFYYVLVLPALLLPWTAGLFAALARLRAEFAQPLPRFLWLWCGFVVAFFSLSGTKLPHYALYGATPVFLLVAWHGRAMTRAWAVLAVPTAMFALCIALPDLFAYLSTTDAGNAFFRGQMTRSLEEAGRGYFVVTGGALVLWLVIALQRRWSVWTRLATGAVLQALVLATTVVPWSARVLQGPVKEAALLARELGGPAVRLRFDAPSFSLYRQAVTPSRPAQPGELVITRVDRVPATGHEELYRKGGVVLLRRTAD